mmetsp:Transcript_4005/g.11635  ORF Transcript_4005/g.11635 Transcript_4005/m.11635 type:complete len:291 (+) Transcript_4005:992-1864(+)
MPQFAKKNQFRFPFNVEFLVLRPLAPRPPPPRSSSRVHVGENARARARHDDLESLALLGQDWLELGQVGPVQELVEVLLGDVAAFHCPVHLHGIAQDLLHLVDRKSDLLVHVVLHEGALLDHKPLQLELALGLGEHSLLHRVGRDQPEDEDGLGLTDPVAPVHGLQVLLRVPVRIVDDHGVRGGQVDAQAPGPRAEEKVVVGRVVVEPGNVVPPFQQRDVAVDPAGLLPLVLQVHLKEVQHLCHLREDQDLVVLLPELCQESVKELHLAALLHQLVPAWQQVRPVVLPGD